jgi:hypothetical protein
MLSIDFLFLLQRLFSVMLAPSEAFDVSFVIWHVGGLPAACWTPPKLGRCVELESPLFPLGLADTGRVC